jgi:putative CRISPR-associated protein (TIGR02619 family)
MLCELIMPIGTSLLTGWLPRIAPNITLPSDWVGNHPNAQPGAGPPDSQQWIPRLKAELKTSKRTSAELDSTRRWLEKQGDRHVSRVHLLVSDTEATRWVAKVMAALLPLLFPAAIEVQFHPIPGLNATDMRQGLVQLIRGAAQAIKVAQDRSALPLINATPGFKAETALLTLLGAVLGAETIYLHEQMQDVITVPALPLRWALEVSEVQALARIGNAAERDVVRELDVGSRPQLWPFLDRIGEGNDEIWALSALGLIAVVSSGNIAVEEPPARVGEWALESATKEQGHRPDDELTLAKDIAKSLPFVTRIQRYGWSRGRQPGLMSHKNDDQRLGFVRLRLRSATGDNRMVLFILHTTAENKNQWDTARQRAAERYGRVSLLEELSEEDTNQQNTYSEMSGLQVEYLLNAKLIEARAEKTKAQELAEHASDQRDSALKHVARLQSELQKARQNSADQQLVVDKLEGRLRTCAGELQSTKERLEVIRQEVDSLRASAGQDRPSSG